jgi:hypothetical protein
VAFKIKQGDTRPNLPWQIFQSDGVTPLSLAAATSVSIVVRPKAGGAMTFKSACSILDAAQGSGIYDWSTGDTATSGDFHYEFEILWNNGDVQTVPVDGYFDLVVVDDIG